MLSGVEQIMAQPKDRLHILGIQYATQKNEDGVGIEFNQPIQLNPKESPKEKWFLPLSYLEQIFKHVRYDK
jgi:hypothetical protein